MGVVYKAEDVKLGRLVALKFLSDNLQKDPKVHRRFQHEAKAASALNHPNICTVHDIGEENGQTFIVMEFLDGVTLKHRISGHPMDLEAVLTLAIQVAEGLDAAHERGIVHRDIKPANIFVTKRDHVKILDFGLAKLVEKTDGKTAETTLSSDADGQGIRNPGSHRQSGQHAIDRRIYVLPEQLRARELDGRSDLFSFGVVLYEMAIPARCRFAVESSAVITEATLNRGARSSGSHQSGRTAEARRGDQQGVGEGQEPAVPTRLRNSLRPSATEARHRFGPHRRSRHGRIRTPGG